MNSFCVSRYVSYQFHADSSSRICCHYLCIRKPLVSNESSIGLQDICSQIKIKGALDQNLEHVIHISEEEALIGEFNFNYLVRNFSSLIRPFSYLYKMSECRYLEESLKRDQFEGYLEVANIR